MAASKAPAETRAVRFRLLRSDDVPATNPLGDAYVFGLQDKRQEIVPGQRLGDRLVFDFSLTATISETGAIVFAGRFASGPVDDRFVYLSWRSVPRGVWINRVKARLSSITAPAVRAMAPDGMLVADMTGRGPGGGAVPVAWHVERCG